jgi:multiple sugar transport system ATP-binding protein
MASISLEKIVKVYPNGFEAVRGIDLEVADGEFTVLVGPSGCGKSTVLRMVAGLEDISSGTLRIGGRVVNDLSPIERDVAMVFQNYALYPHMTVRENIGFALKVKKESDEEIDAAVKEAAHILGLTEWLDRKPANLSGGQRQRVAMGRAIVRRPAVFLMDEPLSNLDAKLRVKTRGEISHIQRRLNVATIYVTHDQVEAMTMGDRVAVMKEGTIEQYAAPQVLYDHPDNVFVATFMGSPSMNLYKVTLGPEARTLTLGSQHLEVPDQVTIAHPALTAYAGKIVVLGLRPEHLSAAQDGDRCVIEGDVDLVEALGNELLVHFSIDAETVKVEEADEKEEDDELEKPGAGIARVDPRSFIKAGTRARFAVATDRMQFFDADTGLAIWG